MLKIDLRSVALVLVSAVAGAGVALAVDHGSTRTVTTTVTLGQSGTSGSQKPVSLQTPSGLTAKGLVEALRCKGIPVGQMETYNERTDENHLLGRPNGYTSKTNWVDTRIPNQMGGFDVDGGGSAEVFSNAADAKDRFDYLAGWTKSDPALAAEYDYLLGKVVLRVSTTLIPSQAADYKKKAEEILASPNAKAGSCQPPSSGSGKSEKPPKPLPATASPYIGGGNPALPGGAPGKVAIVATGTYGNSLPVIVRNNTSQVMTGIRVTGTATGKGGALLATGHDQDDMLPNVVRPGEIAIGYVYFDGKSLPGAHFKLEATGTPQAQDEFDTSADLMVSRASHQGGSITGYLENGLKSNVSGPVEAYVLCFSGKGQLLTQYQNFTDKDSASPGESIPFMVDLMTPSGSNDSCPVFLVAAGGNTG